MSGHVVRRVVCTWSIFDDHVVGLQTESPTFNSQRRSCLLPDKLKRFMVADDCDSRGSLDEPIEMFTRPDYSQRFALALTVSCFDIGQRSASVYDHACLPGPAVQLAQRGLRRPLFRCPCAYQSMQLLLTLLGCLSLSGMLTPPSHPISTQTSAS